MPKGDSTRQNFSQSALITTHCASHLGLGGNRVGVSTFLLLRNVVTTAQTTSLSSRREGFEGELLKVDWLD